MAPDLRLDEFERWYVRKRRHATGRAPSPVTIRNKRILLRRAANRQLPFPELLLDREVFEQFISVIENEMTPSSVRNVLYALRDYGDFIGGHCITKDDFPAKNPDKDIVIYSPEEMELFCSASWGRSLRWGCLINFLAHTGRRVGEALALQWDWFRLGESPPYVELPFTKNGQAQYVPLGEYLPERAFTPENIERLKRGDDAYFHRNPAVYTFPWNYGTIHTRMETFCRHIGVENRGFHNFRHTVITNRLAAGVPIQAVSTLAGHSSIDTTWKRYNHTTALTYADYV